MSPLNFLAQITPINPKTDIIELGKTQSHGIAANEDIGKIISNATTIIMVFGAIAVIFMFLWGAFEWIVSGGDKEKVASARKRIVQALIGLALLALAYLIIFIFGNIVKLNPLAPFDLLPLGEQIR